MECAFQTVKLCSIGGAHTSGAAIVHDGFSVKICDAQMAGALIVAMQVQCNIQHNLMRIVCENDGLDL